jgi:hypothetical protein
MEFLPAAYRQLGKLIRATTRTVTVKNREFTLIDVKPAAHFDDHVYEAHEQLRLLVSRGQCFIVYRGRVVHALTGLRKFGYREQQMYARPNLGAVSHHVFTEKANGECFHVTAFNLEGETYLVSGSKNVHLLTRASAVLEDLALYPEPRYEYAIRMTTGFVNSVVLERPLAALLANGDTWVAESCSLATPHIVAYPEDCLPFFAVTNSNLACITALAPEEAVKCFAAAGVKHVALEVARTPAEYALQDKKWQESENCEGAVVYEITTTGVVSFIYKVKSREYTLWRAVREKMKQRCPSAVIRKRLTDLHVRPQNFDALFLEAQQFNAWARTLYADKFEQVFERWPVVRAQFAQVPTETRARLLLAFDTQYSLSAQVQLIGVGIPGCGKTTVLSRVAARFGGRYLDQDECGGKAPAYHRKARQLSEAGDVPLVAFGKNHHTAKIRGEFLGHVRPGQQVWVVWYHPADAPGKVTELAKVSLERAQARVGHPLPAEKARKVIDEFCRTYEALEGGADLVIRMDATLPTEELVAFLSTRLCELYPHLRPQEAAVSSPGEVVVTREPLYWSIDLDAESSRRLRAAAFQLHGLQGMKEVKNLHVTLLFQDHQPHEQYAALEGGKYTLTVQNLETDERALAWRVEGQFPCENEYPHITMATKNCSPAHSNEMLAAPLANKRRWALEAPLTLTGVVHRH